MIVGLSYDLRSDYLARGFGLEETAEFDREETVSAIESTLQALGYQTERIGHAFALMEALSAGRRWDLVFNIAEGLRGLGRESLVPCLLDAHDVPYVFSDPMVLALTLHKGMAKRVVRDLGLSTPDFAVLDRPEDAKAVDLPYPLFAKPVAEGTGKGVSAASKISDPAQLRRTCARLIQTYAQPVLVETFLPGREFTVGIVGTGPEARALPVMEILLRPEAEAEIYSYQNKEKYEQRVDYRLVDDPQARATAEAALAAYQGLGIRDGGRVDLRLDAEGRPHFIEVNPLAGLHPVHSDLPIICNLAGIPYQALIGDIMRSALARMEASPGRQAA